MTVETKDAKTIPQRSDIATEHTWDLTALYASDEAWENDFSKAKGLVDKARSFSGKLASSAETLYECLQTRTELDLICDNLYQYAKLNKDLDNRVSAYQALTDRAAMLASEASAAYSFLEPELLSIDDDKLLEMGNQFPQTDVYDFYLKELVRSRAHIRSAEVEEVLAQSSMIARGPDSIFSMIDDADIKYPTIKDEDGNEVQLTKQRYAKFMEATDQRVRHDAHDALMSTYSKYNNTLSATLSTAVNKDIFYSKARKYESSLHHALDANNIPVSVYHSLLDTTEANLDSYHKWMAVRKRILKLDKLYPFDVFCPLFPDQNYEVPYDEAVNEVLEAVKPLGEDYGKVMREAFGSRWVDVYETEGKSGGAYSWGNYSSHPFVLMNYNDTVNNMFTLAHELGHSMHSYFSNKTQHYTKARYSIFVAEVASTLNEGLLLQHLLKKVTDKKQKLFLLNRHIDNTSGTFFHQVFFARFELEIHKLVEAGEALSADRLNEIWLDLSRKYYGPHMEVDEISKVKWSRIPHFYYTYYVYQYATSYAASQAILKKFVDGEEGIIEKYLRLISSGGNDYPIEQLRACGVDMTTPDPVEATLKLFGDQVDEVDRLSQD